ncbi:MAG: hypothetical protein NVSMB14_07760 [Isosphaeraceae bacterium]
MDRIVDLQHIEALSSIHRTLAEMLVAEQDPDRRDGLWNAWRIGREDAAEIATAMNLIDPDSPFPEGEAKRRWVTMQDYADAEKGVSWIWEGWISNGKIFGIAAEEGLGKTRFMLDLHRLVHLGLPWPDGQKPTIEPGRKALWVCGDGNQGEIHRVLADYGLPLDSVCVATTIDPMIHNPPDNLDPKFYEGDSLDDPDFLKRSGVLETAIHDNQPWVVVIDTMTTSTSRDLCEQRNMKGLKDPLVRLAQIKGLPVCLIMHTNKEGGVFGRRMKGVTRTLLQLAKPDPESERLKLWVEKSAVPKPKPLGIEMSAVGNTYNHSPPSSPEGEGARRKGPPPVKLDACKSWLLERLTPNPAPVVDLRKDAAAAGVISSQESAGLLYQAKEALGVEEYEVDRRKWWKLPIGDIAEPEGGTPY